MLALLIAYHLAFTPSTLVAHEITPPTPAAPITVPVSVPVAERCEAARSSAAGGGPAAEPILARAADVTGLDRVGSTVLHYRAVDVSEQNFQSDRTYPPYFSYTFSRDVWFDPATGAERAASQMTGGGVGPLPASVTLSSAHATFAGRDTLLRPTPQAHASTAALRPLNVWAVLGDWRAAGDVRVAGRCLYREAWRTVLARGTGAGEERLYVDPESGFPVKLDREEPHYLWGQVRAEYLYSTWQGVGAATLPVASFRLVDGATEMARSFGTLALAPRDSAPRLTLPDTAVVMTSETPRFLQPLPPDTVRVGANAFLLVNPGYTHAVALLGDTVVVFDATQREERSRQDSVWIGKLFPGRHPIAVVVTDLAWPHVAGVRYWVAAGATIISHRESRAFLGRVVDRRWTRAPDLLERRRGKAQFRFTAVADSLPLPGGARLYAIDGIGSEGALMAYLPAARFLWASDYIQTTTQPSSYAAEVWRAAQRAGIAPERTAAQHLRLTPWSVVDSLARR